MIILGKHIAEFVGTFALTFVGAGTIIVCGGENLLAISLAHGLILAVMVTSLMHVSGAQFNLPYLLPLQCEENNLGAKQFDSH